MRKFIAVTIFVGLIIYSLIKSVYAADTLSSFQTTIQKLEISRDGGRTYFTVFDNNTTSVDLVAISGQNVGTFIGSAIVPAGTYNYSRVTVTDSTLQFTVNDGTNGNGTITVTVNDMPAGTFPRTETQSMAVTVSDAGTVNGVINFDAATSYSGLTYTWNGNPAPNQYTLTAGFTFNPNVTVTTE